MYCQNGTIWKIRMFSPTYLTCHFHPPNLTCNILIRFLDLATYRCTLQVKIHSSININDNYHPLVAQLHTSFSKQPHLLRGCNHGLSASTFIPMRTLSTTFTTAMSYQNVILRGCKTIFRNPWYSTYSTEHHSLAPSKQRIVVNYSRYQVS